MSNTEQDSLGGIAVVGLAGRFPKAGNVNQFWDNLRNGKEGISFFTDEELLESGIDPTVFNNPNYVRAGAMLDDMDKFDASFFDYTPREAEAMDPQQRVFLETAWTALENAGYDPEKYEGAIGVYAGISMNAYLYHNIFSNPDFVNSIGGFQLMITNDKDFVGTNVSYKFNLKGPSMTVQTACSTSLVAVCQACQSLLSYQCDMTLVGGVSIGLVKKTGYIHQQGGIASPDGHCRSFDHKAKGTVPGNGVGVVVLKRLADAIADGDHIHAVVRGSALNNDGSLKVGFTAPSVDGQAEVIAMAQAIAGIEADTINYIEAHGTATELGDPIEIAGLTKAFRMTTDKTGYCAIGSVKSNIGHLDAAAGITGFIKTVMALENKEIPPSLHFEKPNPQIDFAKSPFYVNAKLQDWKSNGTPRRAGVSSFGIGGTNAHVVLEEAPPAAPSSASRPKQMIFLSARTNTALNAMSANLGEYFLANPDLNIADAAYTLQVGRKPFKHRGILVCDSLEDAAQALEKSDPKRVFNGHYDSGNRAVAFMFPGQGAQHANMGKELYDTEAAYRETIDHCCELLKSHLNFNLRDILFPEGDDIEAANEKLKQTAITQPAVFVVEYALAKLWISWGVEPQAMIGHSIGEYVAACLAGVFTLEDALGLVAARGRLMQQLPGGSMLAVPLDEAEVKPMFDGKLQIAAINAPSLCVVSGPTPEVDAFEKRLAEKGQDGRRLHTSHAFHSPMMDAILKPFEELVARVKRSAPTKPYISNVSGTWITEAQATDPKYYANHLRNAVRFADGAIELLKEPSRVLLEIGPGRTLGSLSGMSLIELRKSQPELDGEQVVVSSMRHPEDNASDLSHLLTAVGKLWLAGIELDWSAFYANEKRNRLPLPTYSFDWQRYWVEPGEGSTGVTATSGAAFGKKPEVSEWFYTPVWKQSLLPRIYGANGLAEEQSWLVFLDEHGFGEQVVSALRQKNQKVITAAAGAEFARQGSDVYVINPASAKDYDTLIRDLRTQDKIPQRILHLWGMTSGTDSDIAQLAASQDRGFYFGLYFVQALANQGITDASQLTVVANNMHDVTGGETICPEKTTLLGACTVIPQEYLNMTCRSIDVTMPGPDSLTTEKLVEQILNDIASDSTDTVVAYRGGRRWVQAFEPVRIESDAADGPSPRLREEGVYLITGGLGRIGLALAEHLAGTVKAKLVLTSRSGLPARTEWQAWLSEHDENDATSTKIQRVQALEALGAKVLVVSADAADLQQMQKVLKQTAELFGPINGVIHAAGVLEGESFGSILETNKEDCDSQFQPKVNGLFVLEQIFRTEPLDFCLLLSSLSAVLGGLGFIAYSAANAFMDAFAGRQNQKGQAAWISVNWDAWDFTEPVHNASAVGSALAELALRPGEGVEAFKRVMSLDGATQIVVSTADLQTRINKWIQLESIRDTVGSSKKDSSARHARPNMQTEFVAPGNEIEETLAEIWQDLFGIGEVGINDNFFELGGHSLLATGLISRVREAFQLEVSLHSFFEKPTIGDLAEVVLEKMVEREDSDTLQKLLAELEEEG